MEYYSAIKDFPGGAVVKNLPANAGDMGSSPGPGRFHMPRINKARAPQLLRLRSRDFPGGAVVKNPPANAGDTGLIPGPGRSHMPRSN